MKRRALDGTPYTTIDISWDLALRVATAICAVVTVVLFIWYMHQVTTPVRTGDHLLTDWLFVGFAVAAICLFVWQQMSRKESLLRQFLRWLQLCDQIAMSRTRPAENDQTFYVIIRREPGLVCLLVLARLRLVLLERRKK